MVAFDGLWESVLLPFWENICVKARADGGLGVLDTTAAQEDFLELLGRKHSGGLLVRAGNGATAWAGIMRSVRDSSFQHGDFKALQECVLTFIFPRLDAAVSNQMAHLSKAPFSVHAKTGRVCVPVPSDPSGFDPSSAPTVAGLASRDPAAVKAMQRAVARVEHFVKTLAQDEAGLSW